MYYLTAALLLVHGDPAAVEASGHAGAATSVRVADALVNVPAVTIGNVLGGGLLVAAVYWFVYLRSAAMPD